MKFLFKPTILILCLFIGTKFSKADCTANIFNTVYHAAVGAPVLLKHTPSLGATSFVWKDNGIVFRTTTEDYEDAFEYYFGSVGSHTVTLIVSDGTCTDSSSTIFTIVPAGQWTQKATHGVPRNESGTFSIGTNFYMGCGVPNGITYLKDFWKYDELTDTWTQKADVPGSGRAGPIAFSIGGKGYLGTGRVFGTPYTFRQDFYEYDTLTNAWTAKANFPSVRGGAVGCSIGGKGYAGLGSSIAGGPDNKKDFYEYDPVADTWTFKSNMANTRSEAACFVMNGCVFICGGSSLGSTSNDCWMFDPVSNTWNARMDMPMGVENTRAFTLNNRGYILGGDYDWLHGYNGSQFQVLEYIDSISRWSSVAPFPVNEQRYMLNVATIGNKGYAGMGVANLSTNRTDLWQYDPFANILTSAIIPVATLTVEPGTTACSGTPIYISASPYGGATYQWYLDGNPVSGSGAVFYPTVSGNYSVSITTAGGTDFSPAVSVTILTATPPTISAAGAVLTSSAATTYQWYLNGNPISGATAQNYTTTTGGSYTVQTTNSSGCSATSAAYIVSGTNVLILSPNEAVNVYPNPVNDRIILSFNLHATEHVTVKLFNVTGDVVSSIDMGLVVKGNKTFDISEKIPADLKKGIYFIEILAGNKQYLRKIMKT